MTPTMMKMAAPNAFDVSVLAKSVRQWLTYRDTVSELRRLSPRELADIGVEADVEDFAWRISHR